MKKLKQYLTDADNLGYFRLDAAKTQLVTDASNVGLGAVLLQEYQGQTRVISYASRMLTDVETRYSTTEKEALAVVWACEKFHVYLYGIEFELITDHKPLEVLYGPKSRPNARIERWLLKLMSYTYKIQYRPGRENIADVLSRLVDTSTADKPSRLQMQAEEYIRFVAKEASPRAMSTREVEEESRIDEELIAVRKCLKEDKWDKPSVNFCAVRNELSCIGYLVVRGTRLVIPRKLRMKCVELAHQEHLGVVGTKQTLRTKVWWPQMEKDVEKYVRSCHGCQVTGAMPNPEPLKPTPMPTAAWQDVAIDLMGPLPSKHYVFVVVDYYSRFYEVEIMKDTTSERIIEALENMFSRYGLPRSITSDNGPQFRSEIFEKYLEGNDIRHRAVTPLHPAANGEVERQNRSLMKRIRIATAESRNWKTEIRTYLFAYRTTPHTTTGVSPAELMFGRKLRTKLPQLEVDSQGLDEEVRDRDATQKYKNKLYIDGKRGAADRDLQPGDTVLLKQARQDKLTTPFKTTPYTLVQKEGNSVTVQSPAGVRYKRNSTHVKKYNTLEHDSNPEHENVPEYTGSSGDSSQNTKGEEGENLGPVETQIDSQTARPVRENKGPPKWLDDFIVYK